METHSDVIDEFGLADFADNIGVPYGTAKQMRRRGKIAPNHWQQVVKAAFAKGIDDITLDFLSRTYSNSNLPQPHRGGD